VDMGRYLETMRVTCPMASASALRRTPIRVVLSLAKRSDAGFTTGQVAGIFDAQSCNEPTFDRAMGQTNEF
jgi:hypothetical protein